MKPHANNAHFERTAFSVAVVLVLAVGLTLANNFSNSTTGFVGGGSVDSGVDASPVICPVVIGGKCFAREKAGINPIPDGKLTVPPRNDADKQKMIDYLTKTFADLSAKALTKCKEKVDSCVKNGPKTEGETQKVICEATKPCKYNAGIIDTSKSNPCHITKCTAVGVIRNNLRDSADFTFTPGSSSNGLTLNATTGAVTAITFTGNFPDSATNSPTRLEGGINCYADGDETVGPGICSAPTSSADTQGGPGGGAS